MELAEYGRAIARGWAVVLACVLAGLGLAGVVTAQATPVYQSAVKFYAVSPPAVGQSPLQSLELSRGRIAAYASLIKSDKFIDRLLTGNRSGLSAGDIAESISASADPDTRILTVVVSRPDAQQAIEIAQGIVGGLNVSLGEVTSSRSESSSGQTVLNVVAGPTEETAPVSPRVPLNLGLGALLGLGAGIGIVVSRRLRDHTLRSVEDVEEATGLPVLARIPVRGAGRRGFGRRAGRTLSLFDEAGRRLRTNIDHHPATSAARVFVVSSATNAEGKSTVALLLARSWAEAGERVLLVEADMRNPRVAAELGLAPGLGLADLLAGHTTLAKVIKHTSTGGLHAVPAGVAAANPTDLLAGRALSAALGDMRSGYTRVVIDAPSMQPYSDAALLSIHADITVLVVRHGRVGGTTLEAAVQNLDLVRGKLGGTVLNALPLRLSEGSGRAAKRPRLPVPGSGWNFRGPQPRDGAGGPPGSVTEQAKVKHAAPRR